ncbi:MAG: NERD domain-containing protein [Firmicutes bacterium]|nr:NERD domain-containing protein [Bacillota bacterium]
MLLIIAIVILKVYSPKIKGYIGETSVKIHLSRLNKEKYKILNDVLVPNSKGKTSQIDHVIISPYGVFVIETKNYKGWIIGSEDSYQWKQVIYKRKEKMYDPIKQNMGHIKALREVLRDIEYHPIVTFSTKASLKVNVKSDVVYNTKLVKTIKKYHEEVLTPQEVDEIYNMLLKANITDKEAKRDHVRSIKTDLRTRKSNVIETICPKCGGNLVNRKGKYDSFKGCSNYPKCRYTA